VSEVKLLNQRGRVVVVPAHDVHKLLKRGFLHVPEDQSEMTYSQVHDKGDSVVEMPVEKGPRKKKHKAVRLGDSLKVEEI
jgi:hypothetical protein